MVYSHVYTHKYDLWNERAKPIIIIYIKGKEQEAKSQKPKVMKNVELTHSFSPLTISSSSFSSSFLCVCVDIILLQISLYSLLFFFTLLSVCFSSPLTHFAFIISWHRGFITMITMKLSTSTHTQVTKSFGIYFFYHSKQWKDSYDGVLWYFLRIEYFYCWDQDFSFRIIFQFLRNYFI